MSHLLIASCSACATCSYHLSALCFLPSSSLSQSACEVYHETSTMSNRYTKRVPLRDTNPSSSFQVAEPSSVHVATSIGSERGRDYPPYKHFADQISPFYFMLNKCLLDKSESVPADSRADRSHVEHVFELQQLNLFMIKAEAASLGEQSSNDPWRIFFREGDGLQTIAAHPLAHLVVQPNRRQASRTSTGRDHVEPPRWNIWLILA